jgi:outer membrane protein OmpA-like peptidoglycan-associated protein
MKHLKIAILALLLIASYSNADAQNTENPWTLFGGTNFIHIDGGESGAILPYLTKLSLTRSIGQGFSVELAAAANKVERPWSTTDGTYAGVDLNFQYDLNEIIGDTDWFDPYVMAGVGENWIGIENGLGLNLGLGINSWISDSFGISISSAYKKVNTEQDFKMWQHSIGVSYRFGKSGSDSDGDGISDSDDECPDVFGTKEFNGCSDSDQDRDGVNDCCDDCPETPGLEEFNGCPDTDGDGVPDNMDDCPEVAGKKELNGCPDKDGDGVTDMDDACPETPGPRTNAGCPFKDTDSDGVIDLIDNCIDVPGPASNKGCPEVFGDQKTVNEAAKGIIFSTGKAELSSEVKGILDEVAQILNQTQNVQFNFSVDGHTDSTGSEGRNQILSEDRAKSVRSYLMSKGVNPGRLSIKGFGESSPIDTNDTRAGRQNNRRVEINENK